MRKSSGLSTAEFTVSLAAWTLCSGVALAGVWWRRRHQPRTKRNEGIVTIPGLSGYRMVSTLQENRLDGSFTCLMAPEGRTDETNQVIWKVKPKPDQVQADKRILDMQSSKGVWDLVMESGAEFSYWTCQLGSTVFDVEIVSRANEKLIKRYTAQNKPKPLHRETKQDYEKRSKESPEWVGNIIKGLKETERVLHRVSDPDFGYVLAADSKWRDFPDPSSRPYVLGIVEDPKLFTLRELEAKHVAMLEDMKAQCLQILTDRFGVEDPSTIRCFFHYPPQFDWLHIHFCLCNDPRADAAVERAHLLDDVCDRLREKSTFYADATLTVRTH